MMVNEVKNNLVPWQSTVPQQMPWMSSYQPTPYDLQFGQQPNMAPNVLVPNIVNPINQSELQQHPSMASFPTATTLTSPITSCPTSIAANPSFITGGMSVASGCVTATTQSYLPSIQNLVPNSAHPIPDFSNYNPNSFISATQFQESNQYTPSGSLTHIPSLASLTTDKITQQKRSSIEMEDEQIMAEEPPTKQLLSERKLFKQFGSLHLDSNIEKGVTLDDSDDSEEDDRSQATTGSQSQDGRDEFNRYVYLLFKDKKGDRGGVPFVSNPTLDRLARGERDKLSKAVVLWNPPPFNRNFGKVDEGDSDGEEEEFRYSDHRDFLKKESYQPNDSIIITDVTGDEELCNNSTSSMPTNSEPDDVMIE